MALKVLSWAPRPGEPLPDPVIEDDSELIAKAHGSAIVVQVREWLRREAQGLCLQEPTDTVIQLARAVPNDPLPTAAKIVYGPDQPTTREALEWRVSTAEVILRSKDKQITACYRLVVARDQTDRVIAGPMLGVIQRGRLC